MFTYDPTLSDNVSQVRFFIGDTVVNAGPRANTSSDPSNSNFQDEEISAILTRESGSVTDTVAVFLNILATEWSALATSITIGPRKEELWRVSARFQDQLKQWQTDNGMLNKAFSSGVIRRPANANSEFTA